MISKYINAVGVELEGGWKRFLSPSHCCTHICEENCFELNCTHRCNSYCYKHITGCTKCYKSSALFSKYFDCMINQCTHEHVKPRRQSNSCYIFNCLHKHDSVCGYAKSMNFHHDVSVKNLKDCNFSGETVSPPCKSVDELTKFVNEYHPDKVNISCGTHFHISTQKEMDYILLMDIDFYHHFYKFLWNWIEEQGLTKYKPLTDRVIGRNRFCCPNDKHRCIHGLGMHTAVKQFELSIKSPTRYTHINYCFSMHKTIEFRVFHGMKTPSRILRAAQCIIDAVDTYLGSVYEKYPTEIERLDYLKKKVLSLPIAKYVALLDAGRPLPRQSQRNNGLNLSTAVRSVLIEDARSQINEEREEAYRRAYENTTQRLMTMTTFESFPPSTIPNPFSP